jgi:hypothetical protein
MRPALHLGWLFASVVLAAVLLALLFLFTDLDATSVGRLLLGVRPEAFIAIVLLLGCNSFLAGEKWRLIALRLHQDDGNAKPRLMYFAFTSIGVALGQIVPAQLSLVLSRTIGAHLHGGRALVRGATATVLDYFFDLVVAACLGLSTVVVVIAGGGSRSWAFFTAAILVALFLLYGSAARLIAGAARFVGTRSGQRLGGFCASIALSPLLAPAVGRCLLAISGLRFAVLVLIGAVTAKAIGADLALWQIAASLPFSMLANALAITPGGLGLAEWAVSSALFFLGTSFQVSAQWALVGRVLLAGAAVLWGAAGLVIAAAARPSRPRRVV